jgi:sec-independent protein translocase protein TatA
MTPVFAFGTMSPLTVVGLLLLGVLLFGRRLPEIGKYLGKGLVEFKKGLKGLEDDLDVSSPAPRVDAAQLEAPRPPQRVMTTAPKFEDNAGGITTTGAITTPPKP